MVPRKRLAIVTCMDPRLNAMLEQQLGLQAGDAFILRNAGAMVTPDIIRSLAVATCHMGVQEILIVGHTDCGNVEKQGCAPCFFRIYAILGCFASRHFLIGRIFAQPGCGTLFIPYNMDNGKFLLEL